MTESSKTPLAIAFIGLIILLLIFGGGAMTGTMMSGGMMGNGSVGGFGWMWIPTVVALGLVILLGWVLFGKRK